MSPYSSILSTINTIHRQRKQNQSTQRICENGRDFNKVWESCGRAGLHCIPLNIKLHHPNLFLKPIPFSGISVSSWALAPHSPGPESLCNKSPSPSLLFRSFPAPSLEKTTILSKTNISGRAVWPFLSGALTLPTLSRHLLTLVIDQGIFPDKESPPCLLPIIDKFWWQIIQFYSVTCPTLVVEE